MTTLIVSVTCWCGVGIEVKTQYDLRTDPLPPLEREDALLAIIRAHGWKVERDERHGGILGLCPAHALVAESRVFHRPPPEVVP